MKRSMIKLLVPLALLCVPMLAAAGPGAAVSTYTVLPLDMSKATAAYDTLMASAVGKQFKGRLIMSAHLADGADPASVSFISLYHSAAEYQAYSDGVMASEAIRADFLNALVPIAKQVMTARNSIVKTWGDINDTDTIWENFYFTVSDYPAFVAALDAWLASAGAKKFTGQAFMVGIDDAGAAPGTPQLAISVGYANMAEREAFNDSLANDSDWAKYMAASGKVSTYLGADLNRTIKTWGPASMKSFAPK